jgi:hypothetical protein
MENTGKRLRFPLFSDEFPPSFSIIKTLLPYHFHCASTTDYTISTLYGQIMVPPMVPPTDICTIIFNVFVDYFLELW